MKRKRLYRKDSIKPLGAYLSGMISSVGAYSKGGLPHGSKGGLLHGTKSERISNIGHQSFRPF